MWNVRNKERQMYMSTLRILGSYILFQMIHVSVSIGQKNSRTCITGTVGKGVLRYVLYFFFFFPPSCLPFHWFNTIWSESPLRPSTSIRFSMSFFFFVFRLDVFSTGILGVADGSTSFVFPFNFSLGFTITLMVAV